MPTAAQVIDQARTWIGTPYHHQGCLKGVGVDCIGLITGVAKELGQVHYDRPEYHDYPRTPPKNGPGMVRLLTDSLGRPHRIARAGDIGVFWVYEKRKEAHHLAIMTDDGKMIHTYAEAGRVNEDDYIGSHWVSRYICAFTWPELTDA